ncbi:MAG: hypothetical protein M0P77_00710 [Firmicutes bacterium]|nr:hypothetical protein [Bacillota bacterium]
MNIKTKKLVTFAMLMIFCFVLVFGIVGFADSKADDSKREKFTKDLESLVENGVITNEELLKIKDYFQIEREEKKKLFEQMKDMTEEQRRQHMQDYRKNKTNVIDKMVQDKVITQEQAESIKKIMPKHKRRKSN